MGPARLASRYAGLIAAAACVLLPDWDWHHITEATLSWPREGAHARCQVPPLPASELPLPQGASRLEPQAF